MLPCSKALTFVVLLCLASCRTASLTAEAPKPPARASPAQERYKKTVEDQRGPLWYRLVTSNIGSLSVGTVDTTFEIPASGGKVRNLRVTSNTGGQMDELIARRAIEQLRAPPVPPEIFGAIAPGLYGLGGVVHPLPKPQSTTISAPFQETLGGSEVSHLD